MTRNGLRLLLADDHLIVRQGLRRILEAQEGWMVVAEAGNGREAVRLALETKPDVSILDISMPGRDGVETFAEMRKQVGIKEIPVCVVTGHPEFREVIYQRAVPPPEGYMDKPVDEEELVSNLKRILDLRNRKG